VIHELEALRDSWYEVDKWASQGYIRTECANEINDLIQRMKCSPEQPCEACQAIRAEAAPVEPSVPQLTAELDQWMRNCAKYESMCRSQGNEKAAEYHRGAIEAYGRVLNALLREKSFQAPERKENK